MQIVVCLKLVPDTARAPRLDPQSKRLVRSAADAVLNPFDEFALEAALRLRDAEAGHIVTVLSVGPAALKETLRKALAMGADEAVYVSDDRFAGSDGTATAQILAAALRAVGFDLVLCGTQSADGAGGYLPTMLAEVLELPAMTMLRALTPDGGRLVGERSVDGTVTRLSCETPLLASVSKEFAAPRYGSLKGIMAAKKKEIRILNAAELGLSELSPSTEVLEIAAPSAKHAGRVIDAGEPVEAAREIIAFLAERRAL